MGYFNSQIITQSGIELLAKATTGQKIVFDCIKTGDGSYDTKDIAALSTVTDIKSFKQKFDISGITPEKDKIRLQAVISNRDLTEGYDIKEIGVYAKCDGDQESILVAISICTDDTPTHLPKFNDIPVEIFVSNILAYSGNGNFTVKYESDIYVTAETFNLTVDNLKLSLKNVESKLEDIKDGFGTELTETLSAGETNLVLTNEKIKETSTIDIYTDEYGVSPKAATLEAGKLTLVFKAQSQDTSVKVVIC